MAHMGWPWPVFRLKRTKFRFVIRAKKAKISLLISFCKKKIRTFRIVKNTFRKILHRSTSSVGLAGADGEFPVTRAATELMHDLRRKKSTTISPALWLFSFLCSS